MSLRKEGNTLPKIFLDELEKSIAANISNALRQDFSNIKAVATALAIHVEISMETIKKWFNGSNPPKAVHLLLLARVSPSIRTMILQMIDEEKN
jgi:hypothetical protein